MTHEHMGQMGTWGTWPYREEEQHVALRLALVDLDACADGGLEVVTFGLGRVEDLNRVHPTRDLEHLRTCACERACMSE